MIVRAGLLAAFIACSGCAGGESTRRVIPEPGGLDQLGQDVREQYAEYRGELDRLLAEPNAPPSELARAYGQLGMWHDLYEFHDTAIACYLEAEELDGLDPRWPYYLGHVYRDQGQRERGRDAFRRVLELEPQDVPARVWAGEIELADGRPEAAEQLFEQVLEQQPSCVRAQLGLGKASLARQDYEPAIERLERAARMQPSGTEIHYTLGLAYRGRGDLQRAEEHLRVGQVPNRERVPVVLNDPLLVDLQSLRRDHHAVNRRAKELLRQQRYEEAIVELERLVAQDPDTADWRNNLAMALQRSGRLEEAIEQFEEVLSRHPGHAKAHFGRAVLRVELRDPDGAERDYRAAIETDPDYLQARFNLGNLLRVQGRFEEAFEQFDEAVRLDPASQLARYWRAQCLLALGRWEQARAALETDVEHIESDADGLRLLLARLLAAAPADDARDGRRALELARSGHAKTQNLAHAETIAMALAELGEFDAALGWQEACLDAAREAGDDQAARWIRARLERYRAGQPTREVWAGGEHPTRIAVPQPSPSASPGSK